ncbi:MAG: PilN domain-containing protein [Fimbriimonadaceae bacterium]
MKLKLSDKRVEAGPRTVIEWSPDSVRLYEPGAKEPVQSRIPDLPALLGGRPVVVVLSRRSAFVRTTRLPDAAKADVAKILALQLDGLFPVAASELAVDFVMTEDRNVDGRLAIVVAAPTQIIEDVRNELSALNIERILPLALGGELIAQNLELESGAIIEECDEGLSIDVIAGGHLRASRVVPKLANASEIQQEIAKSFAMAKAESGSVIAAGNLLFDGLTRSVADTSLIAISQNPPDLHLEPPQVSAKRQQILLDARKRLAMFMIVAAIGVIAVVYDIRQTGAESTSKVENSWTARIRELKNTKTSIQSRLTKLTALDTTLDRAFEAKQPLCDVATAFTNSVPQGLWLTGMSLERGKEGTVRGISTNNALLTKYLDTLAESDRFRDVKLLFANNSEIEGQPVVNFSITAHVIGNFPLIEAEKKKRKR